MGKPDLGEDTYYLKQAEHYLKIAMRGRGNLSDVARTYAKLLELKKDEQKSKAWMERALEAAKLEGRNDSNKGLE